MCTAAFLYPVCLAVASQLCVIETLLGDRKWLDLIL